MHQPFIRRATIRNYKSIAACRADLRPLMFLVGPNGSGKSNFLDAFRFVSESLRTSLDHALRGRGTIKEVRRRSGGHPSHFSIRLDFLLPGGDSGHYSFRVGAKPEGSFEVQTEECRIVGPEGLAPAEHHYRVESGRVVAASFAAGPASIPDRLYLVAASGLPEFRAVFDALSRIEVYNLNPDKLRDMQKPDASDVLRRDGSNAASVLRRMPPQTRALVNSYLSEIAPGIKEVEPSVLGSQETLEFRQDVAGQKHPWRFLASSMSDGTLRALGILLGIFQAAPAGDARPLLIGLEEPETALHPAATSVLLAALREGARRCQIIVTSHSPDLLDNPDIDTDSLLAVDTRDGLSRIAPVDDAGRDVLRKRLFTPGELLRLNQIAPRSDAVSDVAHERLLGLFELEEA
jgi:predicted ATPase